MDSIVEWRWHSKKNQWNWEQTSRINLIQANIEKIYQNTWTELNGPMRRRDNMKWSIIHIIWVLEGGRKKKMVLKICSKIMTETCWWKTHTWIFRKLNTPKVINSKKSCQDKLGKTKEKEKACKQLEVNDIYSEHQFRWQQISDMKPWQPERSGTLFSRPGKKRTVNMNLYLGELVEEWKVNNDIFRYRETKRILLLANLPLGIE